MRAGAGQAQLCGRNGQRCRRMSSTHGCASFGAYFGACTMGRTLGAHQGHSCYLNWHHWADGRCTNSAHLGHTTHLIQANSAPGLHSLLPSSPDVHLSRAHHGHKMRLPYAGTRCDVLHVVQCVMCCISCSAKRCCAMLLCKKQKVGA